MKTKAALTACTAALLALALSAPVQAKSPTEPKPPADAKARQCFWANNANSFAAADEHVVNVRVGVRDVYQFEMLIPCHEIDWANGIALVTRGSNFICAGMDADIVTRTTLGPQRCAVRSVRKLSPEEIAALEKRARP